MQKTPAQLFKRWGEEKGADKYAKATKPVSDSATTLQHYCCCCLSYMGSLYLSLALSLHMISAAEQQQRQQQQQQRNVANEKKIYKFHSWNFAALANVDADAAVVAVVVVVCAAFVLELHFHAEPHAERRQKRVRARKREERAERSFMNCSFCNLFLCVASRRVCSQQSRAVADCMLALLCSGVGVCVWRLLSFGTCRMFCCCCETFYMPALALSLSSALLNRIHGRWAKKDIVQVVTIWGYDRLNVTLSVRLPYLLIYQYGKILFSLQTTIWQSSFKYFYYFLKKSLKRSI